MAKVIWFGGYLLGAMLVLFIVGLLDGQDGSPVDGIVLFWLTVLWPVALGLGVPALLGWLVYKGGEKITAGARTRKTRRLTAEEAADKLLRAEGVLP